MLHDLISLVYAQKWSPTGRPPLELGGLTHDDPGADRHPVVEVDHVVVHQPETARRHGVPDRLRLVGAVDAVDRAAEIQRARAQRIAGTASHEAGEVGLARDHLGRWGPVGPLRLARDLLQSGALDALAPAADPVRRAPVFALAPVR